ncbi:ATP-binding protein [Sporolactobacillus shoreicorticis]|uniref:histidine kinase n=1 Tax=Sporolactobacillus shoreicorticis TaxID=1923877 RepID=A0ABW5RZW9_9BACL|nr:ATP-binding protein [Sporolactobacillus shoreicorticis]MCO7126819.1 ATP-binding protein [Sporolactobacillus shoreicorticis]
MSSNSNSTELDFKKMIDLVMDAILILGGDEIVYSNRAANRLLSFDEHTSLSGLSIGMFLDPSDMPIIHASLNKICCRQSDMESVQLSIHSSSNVQIPAEITLLHFSDQDQSLVQLTIRDISTRKIAEESMIQSEKLSVIGELSAGILHEIRNPLTSIKGFLQLMQTTEQLNQDYLDIIMREIEQIEKITSELLYFTKPRSERFAQVDLSNIAHETLQLFESQAMNLRIQMVLDTGDCSHFIFGDKTQLKQVFVNLIKNALEAIHRDGTITIRLTSVDQYEKVLIQDTGSGIPQHIFNNLGKSFFTTKASGTGLGLMVTYTIVKNHKGSVNVTSKEHSGTTFHLRFPKVTAD